ncbi:hypothetical protein IJU85_02165 [Candidatus Saccharibacteria bacterium]|nr:hypothetical protein [Candidatus Saccharibacteria bacterium]
MIDVDFDFTNDAPGYWDGFWGNSNLGMSKMDPDSGSRTLQRYQQVLWSRELPNGEKMDLKIGDGADYLTWKDFRFGSDSIIASFRYEKCRGLLEQVMKKVPDYKRFVEEFLRKTYTIGGEIIFPKHANSINQARGCNKSICDRFDLTLECIRRFYAGEDSPLGEVLKSDKKFFDLFVGFRGYVDFFLLQDLVSDDYKEVKFWTDWRGFDENPIPKDADEYLQFIENELEFVSKRNSRIAVI